jgi:hypothetical protein
MSKNIKIMKKTHRKITSYLMVISLVSILIFTADTVYACHYTVDTFESDYTTPKDSFFKGEIVYGKGNAYGYNYPMKLRIRDPSGNYVYYSEQSTTVVYGSYLLNNSAQAGTWIIQLGAYISGKWQWSTGSGRIAYFSVSDINFSLDVYSDGNGIVAVDPDQATYTYGTLVNLTAVPNSGYSFSHWSGDLISSNNPENIIMDSDKTVNAHFTQDQYALTISVDGNGSVVIDPDQTTYIFETIVNLTADPDEGWVFSHWTGDLIGSNSIDSIVMDSDKSVSAHFTEGQYLLNIIIEGNGSVIRNPDQAAYSYGSVVELTALADSGYTFSHWTGDLTGNNNSETIIMDSDKTINAHFIQEQYTLTININGNGIVAVDPDQATYTYGTLVNLTAVPNSGYSFSHWSGDFIGDVSQVTINMNKDKEITANFVAESSGGGNNGGGSSGSSGNTGYTTSKPNIPPVANLSAGELYVGFVNEEIEFNGSYSYDLDGEIIQYLWDFGDGTIAYSEIMTHNYSNPGEYKVTLKVTDNKGASDIDETIAFIIKPNHPPSIPKISGPTEGYINIEYEFSVVSTDEDNDSVRYIFSWGDGTYTESDFLPSGNFFITKHKWTKAGNYTIKVTSDDNTSISTMDITIIIDDPKPTIPKEDNICLIILAILGILLLILFLFLAKRKKEDEDEN